MGILSRRYSNVSSTSCSVRAPGDDSVKWFREHGAQLGEVYIEGLKTTTSGAGTLVTETGSWLRDIANKLQASGGLFGRLAGELVGAFADAWTGFDGWFGKIGEGITGLISAGASGNIAVIYDYIMDLLYHLTNGLMGKDANIDNLGNNIPKWLLQDNGEIAEGVKRFVKTLLNMLTLGIFSKGEDAVFLGELMNDRVLAGLADTPQEALAQIISGILSSLLKFAGAVLPDLIVLGGEVVNAMFTGMLDFISQGGLFKIIGAIFKGLWNGFIKSEINIFNLGWRIAKALWQGFLAMLGIHSPSTMFEDAVGYIVDGIINGVTKLATTIWNAGVALAKKLWDGFCGFLGIHSRSRKFLEGAGFCIEGIADGLGD